MFTKKPKRIFLDYAAATPISKRAYKAYVDALQYFANPQALHTEGLQAHQILEEARSSIAKILGVKAQEITFTSGGTESNNLALAGYLLGLEEQGIEMKDCHIIVSAIEHPSVSDVFTQFRRRGLSVTLVKPNEHGEVKPETVEEVLQENTVLVSLALVNSEVGTVQPIHAIGALLKSRKPKVGSTELERIIFHTDACQGMYRSLVPQGLNVDLMSLDSGKMYGPRGVGALYVRQGVRIAPVLRGGTQEKGLRPGTENLASISGFAAAFTEAAELRASESTRLQTLRKELFDALRLKISGVVMNGTAKSQTPHILSISIPEIDAEYVATYLDQRGVALTTKSACLERTDANESHVVASLGGEKWRATNTLRISFGRETTLRDIPTIVSKLYEAVEKYRSF